MKRWVKRIQLEIQVMYSRYRLIEGKVAYLSFIGGCALLEGFCGRLALGCVGRAFSSPCLGVGAVEARVFFAERLILSSNMLMSFSDS